MLNLNITLLGNSGAGKTTFILGLYKLLGEGSWGGYHLDFDQDTIRRIDHVWRSHVLNGNGFPPGTQNVMRAVGAPESDSQSDDIIGSFDAGAQAFVFSCKLRHDNKELMSVTIYDYRGGVFEGLSRPPDYAELESFMQKSDAAMVVISSTEILHCDIEEAKDTSRIAIIAKAFDDHFTGTNNPIFPVSVVFTKFDSIEKESVQTFETRAQTLLGILLRHTSKNPRVKVAAFPATFRGRGRAKTDIVTKGYRRTPRHTATELPKPAGMTAPFFFCVCKYLELKIFELDIIARMKDAEADSLERNSGFLARLRRQLGYQDTRIVGTRIAAANMRAQFVDILNHLGQLQSSVSRYPTLEFGRFEIANKEMAD